MIAHRMFLCLLALIFSCFTPAGDATAQSSGGLYDRVCVNPIQDFSAESLKSRRTFCVKSSQIPIQIYNNNDGTVTSGNITQYTYAELGNDLTFRIYYRFRLLASASLSEPVYARPVQATCPSPCNVSQRPAQVELVSGGLSSETSSLVQIGSNLPSNFIEFFPNVDGTEFGTAAQIASGSRGTDFGTGYVPKVACDIGLAFSGEQGCVFGDYPAIFELSRTDTPESARHVADVTDPLGLALPGLFTPIQGSVVASLTEPLSRSRDYAANAQRRLVARNACPNAADGTNDPLTRCAYSGDPEDGAEPVGPCDCDEYPFASSDQGATVANQNPPAFSVRRIPSGDNRSSGSQLGAFYRRERVIDSRVPGTDTASRFFVRVIGTTAGGGGGGGGGGGPVNLSSISFPSALAVAQAPEPIPRKNPYMVFNVDVVRTGDVSTAATISYSAVNGSAVGGINFLLQSGSLSWVAGESGSKEIPILIYANNSTNTEFSLALSNPSGASIGSFSTAQVQISKFCTSGPGPQYCEAAPTQ